MQIHTVVNCTAGADSYRCQLYSQRRILPLSTVQQMRRKLTNNSTFSGDSYRQLCFQSRILPLSTGLTVQNHISVNCTASDESYRKQYFQWRFILASVLPLEIHTSDCTASADSYQHLCCQRRSVEDVSTVTARLQRSLQLLSQYVAEASSGDVDCSGSFYF